MDMSLLQAFEHRDYYTMRGVYQDFLELVVNFADSEIGYFHLYEEASETLSLTVWSKSVLSYCTATTESHYPLSEAGIWADAIRERHWVVHNQYTTSQGAQGLPEGHFKLLNHLAFPLFIADKIVAVIGVGNKSTDYQDDDIRNTSHFIDTIWQKVGHKVNRIKVREQLIEAEFLQQGPQQILLEMLKAISHTLELRDPYTTDHQKHVAYICTEIGKELQLEEKVCLGLYVGALIHDIGKMLIPSSILTKPGALFAEELLLLKAHPRHGLEIFRDTHFPWPIKDMIGQHHERLDGSGYPNGLTEHEICLEAKIIAVADTFDAMSNDRPYRVAPGKKKAIEVLMQGRGIVYDHYVVDAFMRCYERDPTFAGCYG